MKVGIYYVATDMYRQYFDGFVDSIADNRNQFFPGAQIVIKYFTDIQLEPFELRGISVEPIYITDYPWPVLTIYRPYLINKYRDESLDYCFSIASNLLISNKFDTSKMDLNTFNSFAMVYHEKDYVQGGIYGGAAHIFYDVNKAISDRVNECINVHHHVPEWHEETEYNEIIKRFPHTVSRVIYVLEWGIPDPERCWIRAIEKKDRKR